MNASANAVSPFPQRSQGWRREPPPFSPLCCQTGSSLFTATEAGSTSVAAPGVAQGSTGIIDLSGTIAGVPVSLLGFPTPNEEIASGTGFSVILNQQILSTAETKGITTNAIAIVLKDFGPSDVTGNIDFGQSTASLTVIPEPATWVDMLAGFGAVGLLMARARSRSKATAET